tara:strand:- start:187 stop:999 length:813 start_codon:yes stop_codon:yes gene_type:complete
VKRFTEQDSIYKNLETMKIHDLLKNINHEDQKVAKIVKQAIPKIEKLVTTIVSKLKLNGRLFYIGSGTSGRLGILDASECPPTFGVSHDKVIGLIAGGDSAIRKAIENAEDDNYQAWSDLKKYNICKEDIVIGITASGTTPYVVGGLKKCFENNIYTAAIICNEKMPISKYSNNTINLIVGPEFVTGSTRMKAGTAQKMTLNMISTSVMIKLGHILDNKMIDMHINNVKLEERAINIIMNMFPIDKKTAKILLEKYGNIRSVIKYYNDSK